MNTMTMEPTNKLPFSSEDWDKLRFLLQDSMMADTNLAKLAVNMGEKWPIRGKEETPRKYISHNLEELADMPEFFGKGNRLSVLYSVLKETQAFDDPFREMVNHLESVAEQENEALKCLQQLEIPADFPVALCDFSSATLTLCKAEDVIGIGHLIDFSQKSAKTVILGGEFKDFLNALVQLDIKVLVKYLPIRPGESGLFLAESIAQIARTLTDREAASLLKVFQVDTRKPSWSEDKALSKSDTLELISRLRAQIQERFGWMPDQAQQLRHAVASSEAERVRFFVSLRDPEIEGLSLAIAKAALEVKPRFNILMRKLRPA